jgi:predicted ArsR family transcriptional regulator
MDDEEPTPDPGLDARIDKLAALGEPVRRDLYRYVAARSGAVTREQAAAGIGVAVHTAKFHLDRLVDDGFLDADYQRPAGRSGPGAGRPAKVYRRSSLELEVSVPERHYDLAGRLMAKAIAASGPAAPVVDTLHDVARLEGTAAGTARRAHHPSRTAAADALVAALELEGYEPVRDGHDVLLANCPFHVLAKEETELVCGMNLAYLDGVVDGIGAVPFRVLLDPAEGRCCVRLTPG